MSYYYRYNFTTPEIIYATVKEEFKSYFDTGAIDDLMFPTYLDKCLQKLGRSSYLITEEALYIEDFQSRLPDNFHAAREAWLCIEHELTSYQDASSFYSQTGTNIIQISPLVAGGPSCGNPACNNEDCTGDCLPEVLQAVYKTNSVHPRFYRKDHLLKPGNISVRQHCDVDYSTAWNFHDSAYPAFSGFNPQIEFTPASASYDSFDIRDNKFVTSFRHGIVHLVFYATEYDKIGNQMVPDNYRIREFVESFIKYKMMETLVNQTNDETFQQLQQKLVYYKQLHDEAFIMAMIEIKKQDPYAKQRRVAQDLNRLKMYELPNRIQRYGWRRNN
jgi:hypothetical protein